MKLLIALAAVAVVASALTQGEIDQLKPDIVARSSWDQGNTNEPDQGDLDEHSGPIETVVLSHTDSSITTWNADPYAEMVFFEDLHIDNNGWADIAYHYVIGFGPIDGNGEGDCDANGDGKFPAAAIYEARDVAYSPAVVSGYNDKSLGLAFVGNYIPGDPDETELNGCQIQAAKDITAWLVASEDLKCDANVKGASQMADPAPTASPGQNVIDHVNDIRGGCQENIDRLSAPTIDDVPWVWYVVLSALLVGGAAGAGLLYSRRAPTAVEKEPHVA